MNNTGHTNTKAENRRRVIGIKPVIRYAMLPGIIPRIRELGLHFGHFAYLIALVLHSARLIPDGHPALQAVNIGRFGVRQVLAIAANNITWSKNNIDQIAVFSAIVMGIILIIAQAFLIAAYAVMGIGEANATATPSADSYFTTPKENVPTDVVLIFLDQVFGANLSVFGAASQPLGTSVHLGMQEILRTYSIATMIIAVIIVLYYILTVIAEAAQTGTPFGRRFNSVWAPVRLIVALGLLIPLGSGLNSAQYITLWTAKMGSGLGTKVWITFVSKMTETQNIISKPAPASMTALVKRIFLNEVCAAAYNQIEEGGKQITIVQQIGKKSILPTFDNAQAMINNAKNNTMGDVIISWSDEPVGKNPSNHACGFVSVSLTEFDLHEDGKAIDPDSLRASSNGWINWLPFIYDTNKRVGGIHGDIKAAYLSEVKRIADAVRPHAKKVAEVTISIKATQNYGKSETLSDISDALTTITRQSHNNVNTKIVKAYSDISSHKLDKSLKLNKEEGLVKEMVRRGWGAAGVWYANIGKINQKFTEAVETSAVTLGTIVDAEEIDDRNQLFEWVKSFFGASRLGLSGPATSELNKAIDLANKEFELVGKLPPNDPLYADAKMEYEEGGLTGWFARTVLWLFGTGQLTDLKNNPQLDPMARLMGAGNTMLNRSLALFGLSALAAGIELFGKITKKTGGKKVGEFAGVAKGILIGLGMVGLFAGMFLFFILPLIPFVYFSFAVIAWILEIFEAVVAMPLWALAHLRIDGDGMPGGAAVSGYSLLLMILLRPALIVMGLIGGYVIFGAAVFFLSSLFNGAVGNLRGEIAGGSVGAVSVFVYTVIFVFLVYNISVMCFKMIDDVPKGILRWLGVGVQTFGDSRGDPISGQREVVVGAIANAQMVKQAFQRDPNKQKPSPSGDNPPSKDAPSGGETTKTPPPKVK